MPIEALPRELLYDWSLDDAPTADAFAVFLGPGVPDDLRRFRPKETGGFLLTDPRELLEEENCFAAAIRRTSGGVLEPVLQVLTSTWFVSSLPAEGDCLMAHTATGKDLAEIVYWSHEESCFFGPVGADIPSAVRIVEAVEARDAVEARRARVLPALARVVTSRWPFSQLASDLVRHGVLEAEPPGDAAPTSHFTNVHDRCYWVAQALAGLRVHDDQIRPQLDWTPDAALAGPHLRTYAPTALYWIWRCFLLDEPALTTVLTATEGHPARVVRDAAALVRRVLAAPNEPHLVGHVDLAFVRDRCKEVVAHLRDPLPSGALRLGAVVFERDDARLADVGAPLAPATMGDAPAPDQAEDPRWGEDTVVLARSPDGTRRLLQGHRKNPLFGRVSYAPSYLAAVLEVDEAGRLTFFVDAADVVAATYVTNDLLVLAGPSEVQLVERYGDRGVRTQRLASAQATTLFADGGRTVVRFGGAHDFATGGPVARSVELLRVDGFALRRIGQLDAPIDVGGCVGDTWILGARSAGRAYVARLTDVATDAPGLALAKTGLTLDTTSPRVGPPSVVDTLGFNDWCLRASSGRCLVLAFEGGQYRIRVGDEEHGLRDVAPELYGQVSANLHGADHATVATPGKVWLVELASARATLLADFGDTGLGYAQLADHGVARLLGETLVAHWLDGERRELPVGPGASALISLHGLRAVALRAHDTLVVLGLDADRRWMLLGAADPTGPLAGVTLKDHDLPWGVVRAHTTLGSVLHELVGIDAAREAAAADAPLQTLPPHPWTVRGIAVL